MALNDYTPRPFTAPVDGVPVTHDVYEGGSGPAILLVQELPGIGPSTVRLADELRDQGLTVAIPRLFGPFGEIQMVRNIGRVLCMRREFTLFAGGRSSPVVDWLRALARDCHERHGGPGVGMIGMCLTGNFAMSMVVDPAVRAAVASQPSMPIGGSRAQNALHMTGEEVQAARAQLDDKGPMLALRFEEDPLCRAAKFGAIDAAFNDDRERVRLRVLPGKGHSVLTEDFVNEAGHPTRTALDEVLQYFRAQLLAS